MEQRQDVTQKTLKEKEPLTGAPTKLSKWTLSPRKILSGSGGSLSSEFLPWKESPRRCCRESLRDGVGRIPVKVRLQGGTGRIVPKGCLRLEFSRRGLPVAFFVKRDQPLAKAIGPFRRERESLGKRASRSLSPPEQKGRPGDSGSAEAVFGGVGDEQGEA